MSKRTEKPNEFSPSPSKTKGDLVEDVVALLYEGADVDVQTRVQLPVVGTPNRTREIDVLVTGMFSGRPIRLAIECKNYSQPVGIEKIGEFRDKLDDVGIPPQLGIFVTASSFTSGALDRANALGLHTLVLTGLTPDRMATEVQDALQSIVYLLLVVAQLGFRTDRAEPAPGPLLEIVDRSGNVRGTVLDWVWAKWRDGDLPSEIGEHRLRPRLPKGWRWVTDGGIPARSVALRLEVIGLVTSIHGKSERVTLSHPTTGATERFRVQGSFQPGPRSLLVTVVNNENQLLQLLAASAATPTSITIGRSGLPRILYEKMFWPPSERVMRTLAERVHQQVKQGNFHLASLRQLTFEEMEGKDLSRVWDAVVPEHPAASDPMWSPLK